MKKSKTISPPKKKFYTYEDYAKLPEGAPYQLIGGQLVMSPSPTPYHQRISKKLGMMLLEFVEEKNKIGEVLFAPLDVYFEETETYQPDVIYIPNGRIDIVKEKKIEGAPDLLVEILSPSTAYYDLKKKKAVYEKHGVKEYWIVDPEEKTVEVFENQNRKFILVGTFGKDDKLTSKLLPGLTVDLSQVF